MFFCTEQTFSKNNSVSISYQAPDRKVCHTSNWSPGPFIFPGGSTSSQQPAVEELSIGHLIVWLSKAPISKPELPSNLLIGDWHSQCLIIMRACDILFRAKFIIRLASLCDLTDLSLTHAYLIDTKVKRKMPLQSSFMVLTFDLSHRSRIFCNLFRSLVLKSSQNGSVECLLGWHKAAKHSVEWRHLLKGRRFFSDLWADFKVYKQLDVSHRPL